AEATRGVSGRCAAGRGGAARDAVVRLLHRRVILAATTSPGCCLRREADALRAPAIRDCRRGVVAGVFRGVRAVWTAGKCRILPWEANAGDRISGPGTPAHGDGGRGGPVSVATSQ